MAKVLELLDALIPRIKLCRDLVSPVSISNSLVGLQRIGDSPQMRELFAKFGGNLS